jgi:hypothetical protein
LTKGIDEDEIRADVTFTLQREEDDRQQEKDIYALIIERTSDRAKITLRFPLEYQELRTMRARLSRGLDDFREQVADPGVTLSEERAANAARYLESTAWAILTLLCAGLKPRPSAAARDVVVQIRNHLLTVFGEARPNKIPVIRLVTPKSDPLGTLLPLEFLPVVPVDERPSAGPISLGETVNRYLGFRAIIIRSQRTRALEIPRNADGRLPVRSFSYRGQDLAGVLAQRQFFKDNRSHIHVALDWPEALGPASADSSLAGHLLNGTEIIHFACHYDTSGPGSPPEPALRFGGGVTVRLWSLRGELGLQDDAEPAIAGERPLIFLNACETAAPRMGGETLVDLLSQFGYGDIIGSETLMPDGIAGKFAAYFYAALLRQPTIISKAILQARLDLIAHNNNPAGILYTLYGNPGLWVTAAPPKEAGMGAGASHDEVTSPPGLWQRLFGTAPPAQN